MGYKPSKHKNALNKLLREKELILQLDAAKIFNMKSSGNLQTAVEQLENEGKLKRTKIKVRHKNGNLINTWLLYLPSIDYNKVIDYEKEMVNQPFESPLKEHHCYKRTEIVDQSNVIDMQEYVKVNEKELLVKEYKGNRIVTLADVDNAHNRPKGTARVTFNRNKHHFILGEDYFELEKDELSHVCLTYAVHKNTTKLTILTESGYLLLVKAFTDDLSWTVQRQLVNTYFKMKQLSKQNETQPIPANSIQSLDIMEMMIKEMKKEKERVDNLENKLNRIVSILAE